MRVEQTQKQMDELIKKHSIYDGVFNTVAGKDVLKDLSKRCFSDKSTFSSDPLRMAYNAGKRDVYLHLVHFSDPNVVSEMKERLTAQQKG